MHWSCCRHPVSHSHAGESPPPSLMLLLHVVREVHRHLDPAPPHHLLLARELCVTTVAPTKPPRGAVVCLARLCVTRAASTTNCTRWVTRPLSPPLPPSFSFSSRCSGDVFADIVCMCGGSCYKAGYRVYLCRVRQRALHHHLVVIVARVSNNPVEDRAALTVVPDRPPCGDVTWKGNLSVMHAAFTINYTRLVINTPPALLTLDFPCPPPVTTAHVCSQDQAV